MAVQVKFCGLTRAADVLEAARLGAEYAGVVFAGGPRERTVAEAAELFRSVAGARKVGVFAGLERCDVAEAVAGVPLDVVQLHRDATVQMIAAARGAGAGEVWAVVRVEAGLGKEGGDLPPGIDQLFLHADAVVLDTRTATGLGGTGKTFDWESVADELQSIDRRARLVVAGGLNPDNVASAIRALRPDVVDVSSGVESAPGGKDHSLMRRFIEAARST